MFRSFENSKAIQYLCKSFINQISKRYQSANVALEPNLSDASYTGHIKGAITNKLHISLPEKYDPIPLYQVLDPDGEVKDKSQIPDLSEEHLVKIYRDMTLLNVMDRILYESQRHGRISFYMTHFGEEATSVGSAAALNLKDMVYSQYREAGVLMYRGFKLSQFTDQCFGNFKSSCKGIQMPIHYGSKELNFVTISSTMGTQMPQAVGSAYSYKRAQNGLCVICYFGDGTASEGDAHAAFNFAATLDVPMIFFCRNNGYAISTPSEDQYRSDGIAIRGAGYGMATIRVDGNDVFAVYNATRAARQLALSEKMRPVLIEAMTYRVSHHSTSDDSAAYRSNKNVEEYDKKYNPIIRFFKYLTKLGYWNEEKDADWKQKSEKMVMEAFRTSEELKRAPISTMFENIFDKMEPHLKRQMQDMNDHVRQHNEHYPVAFHQESLT